MYDTHVERVRERERKVKFYSLCYTNPRARGGGLLSISLDKAINTFPRSFPLEAIVIFLKALDKQAACLLSGSYHISS